MEVFNMETLEETFIRVIAKCKGRCQLCDRLLPNEDYRTEKACIWCDSKYWSKGENK